MNQKHSLILITVDCLRADHTGFGGYPLSTITTPALDALAQQSLVFPCTIVGGAPTYYSFPCILGGRHPLALGRDVIGLAPQEPTLASVLRTQGYATAGFSAGNVYLSRRFGYAQGFDVFRDYLGADFLASDALGGAAVAQLESGNQSSAAPGDRQPHKGWSRLNAALARSAHQFKPLGKLYDEFYFRYGQRVAAHQPATMDELRRYPSADVLVDEAGPWLAGVAGQPFFLWLHFMDPHHPYYPPEQALAAVGRPDLNAKRARELSVR